MVLRQEVAVRRRQVTPVRPKPDWGNRVVLAGPADAVRGAVTDVPHILPWTIR